jgi:hypothetical protein
MVIQDVGSLLVIPLELADCMIHFKHRLPTTKEVNSLKQYCLTHNDTPWNPSSFSDQVVDKFCQQVIIDNEQKNSLNTKSDYSSDIEIDLVEKGIPKFSYFDSYDVHSKNIKGKYANLVFHIHTTIMNNINVISQLNKDSSYGKSLPDEFDYEKLSPYCVFRQHDIL